MSCPKAVWGRTWKEAVRADASNEVCIQCTSYSLELPFLGLDAGPTTPNAIKPFPTGMAVACLGPSFSRHIQVPTVNQITYIQV